MRLSVLLKRGPVESFYTEFGKVFTNTTISMGDDETKIHLKKYNVKVWTGYEYIPFSVEARDELL